MLGPGPVEGFVAKMTGETEKHSWRTEGVAKSRLDFLTRYGKDYFLLMFIYREQLLANYVDTSMDLSEDMLALLFIDFLTLSIDSLTLPTCLFVI